MKASQIHVGTGIRANILSGDEKKFATGRLTAVRDHLTEYRSPITEY
jgi:hypothetical protein